jgi:HK97 family phage prohead protease
MKEFKTFESSIQTVNDHEVTGIAAVFGNVDLGRDRIHPGAFRKTISERKSRIVHLWGHDQEQPPTAKIVDLKEIGRNELPADLRADFPDATGGLMVTRQYLNTPRATEILEGIKSGAITGMSFGYEVPRGKADYEKAADGPVRNIREIKLWEVSDVLYPMNPATRAAKSLTDELSFLMERAQDLTDLMAVGQTLTPEELNSVQQVIASLQAILKSVSDASMSSEEAPMEMMSAVPPAPDQSKAHTVNAAALLARLAIAEREYA